MLLIHKGHKISIILAIACCGIGGGQFMEWFNVFGFIFVAIMMIPNIIYAINCKDGFENLWINKPVEVLEQIGRFGCFGFMVINIRGTWFGFP